MSFALESYIFVLWYGTLLSNASKIWEEVKFAIKSDSQDVSFFAVFNCNIARNEICLKFIFNAK